MRERFHLASDEARSAVNNDRMLVEKFIDRRIRHISNHTLPLSSLPLSSPHSMSFNFEGKCRWGGEEEDAHSIK